MLIASYCIQDESERALRALEGFDLQYEINDQEAFNDDEARKNLLAEESGDSDSADSGEFTNM